MKVRIREGNDFDVVWAITRAGEPEDLSTATSMKLKLVVYGLVIEHSLFTVTDNMLSINIPKEVATIKGDYRLVFEYTLPDAGQPDGDLKCKTDVVPFRIVPFTADADDVYTVNTSSDVLLGFKGDKGEDGDDAYQIWLDLGNEGTYEDFIAYMRQPAVDAVASIDGRVTQAESDISQLAGDVNEIKDLTTIYNVTQNVPLESGYYTLETAIAAVPTEFRKCGMTIVYSTEDTTWYTAQFLRSFNTPVSDAQWLTLDYWETPLNEFLIPCFVRNQSDLSTLDISYKFGYKRKLKYQAFKGLKLYGFDTTKKYMISHFWVDSYDASHYYRIIIKQWDGSAWVSYFDTGTVSKTDLGVVDGKIFTWDKTIGTKRMIAQIDFSNLQIGDNTTLNAGEPDLLINPDCIYDQELSKTANAEFNTLKLGGQLVSPISIQNISGVKPYFNSRRKPTFAFIWDDLNPTDALVFSIFQEYNFLPSFALISNNLNAANAPEYQTYYMKGCTILAHSISHQAMSNPATITYEEVDNQMKTSKEIIESYGMRVSGWVTPQSSLDISFFPLMVKNFGYGFTGLNGGLFNSTVDPLKMSRYGIESAMSNHDHTTIINRIDSAITNNELVVFYGHRLPSTYLNGDSTPYVTEDDLRFVLDYLKTKTDDNLCQVLSADEAVYQYYKQPFI